MYRNFAAWFMIWSRQTPTKSMNISSATGRRPRRGRADRGADVCRFGDRRVQHAARANLSYRPFGHAEHAAPGVVLAGRACAAGDVLAHAR